MPSPTCRHLVERLDDLVLRDLPPDLLARFERHLQLCPPCQRYLREYRSILHGLERVRSSAATAPEPGSLDRLSRAVLARVHS